MLKPGENRPVAGRLFIMLVLLSIICLCLTTVYARYVLQMFPNSGDEYAYLFQSATFQGGRLYNPTHPMQQSFRCSHIPAKDGKWVGRFPPGWPALLALAGVFHIPAWLCNPILSLLVLWVLFLFAREVFGTKVALITAAALVCTPFFIFNGASYFAHMATLLFLLLFYYHGILFCRRGNVSYGVLAGIWIGCAFVNRPFTALLVAAPFLIYFFVSTPWRQHSRWIWFLAGSAPLLLLLLYYNRQITGNPFLQVTTWVDAEERLGFVKGYTPLHGLRFMAWRLRDLLYWASPAVLVLLPPAFWFAIRLKRGWAALVTSVFIVVVLGYFFYWSYGGNQYGPRFYFEAYPFASLGVAAILFGNGGRIPGRRILQIAFILGAVFSVCTLPRHTVVEHGVIDERRDLYNLVERENIENAVVIVSSDTGVQRPMAKADLIRNGINLDASVLYAVDLGEERNNILRKHFNQREFYRYTRRADEMRGRLQRIR
jgi:hypothetical protein